MATLLNLAPCWEETTAYSLKWNQRLMAALRGCVFSQLLGDKATRLKYMEAVKDPQIRTVVFYDHGSSQGLVEDGGAGYILDESNLDTVKGKEVYTMCCLTAGDLGKEAYRRGTPTWWGYKDAFSFMPQQEEIYGRLANMGLLLVKNDGLSWRQAYEKVVEAFNEAIKKAETGDPWVEITLVNDRDALVCWANWNEPPTESLLTRILNMILDFLRRIWG